MNGSDDLSGLPPRPRDVFCNRTLNLRAITAVGYDMDYTLVHYDSERWERRCYERVRDRLVAEGLPVGELQFDPTIVAMGLVIDVDEGNAVKANRFGFVKRACHGTRMLGFDAQREAYSRLQIDLAVPRWQFMNTLFSLSEACLFLQMVDAFDAGALEGPRTYTELFAVVRSAVDQAHVEGELKKEIAEDPSRFVILDEELPLSLLDLKHAGKKLVVITNSEWSYTQAMMSYAFDRFLPGDSTWRDLFDLVVVAARKPGFFTGNSSVFEVVQGDGLLRPVVGDLVAGRAYLGGNADLVERFLACPGEQILYVGDHVFADVHVSKAVLRWRTALVARALEDELAALVEFAEEQRNLNRLMDAKRAAEHRQSRARLELQRAEGAYGPEATLDPADAKARVAAARRELAELDDQIRPLAEAAGRLGHPRWGLLMRAGNDKSHLARQVERHADIYTSRASNLLLETPFAYLRSPYGSLPHDGGFVIRTMHSRSASSWFLVFVAVAAFGACANDSRGRLDDACAVAAGDCNEFVSSSVCIDRLGDQTEECLRCIVEHGCDYPEQCSRTVPACRFPSALDGG